MSYTNKNFVWFKHTEYSGVSSDVVLYELVDLTRYQNAEAYIEEEIMVDSDAHGWDQNYRGLKVELVAAGDVPLEVRNEEMHQLLKRHEGIKKKYFDLMEGQEAEIAEMSKACGLDPK